MYICTQFILVTHMPMKLKRKKKGTRPTKTLTEPMFYLEKTDGKQINPGLQNSEASRGQ